MATVTKVTIDERALIKQYMRSQGVKALLELVSEVVNEDANPLGCPDATPESAACYWVSSGLDDIIMNLEQGESS